MHRSILKRVALVSLFLAVESTAAWALGEEEFGNKPVAEPNYTSWPGILPTLNQPSRVYRRWVNGNEQFYYQGDTAALNDTLRAFSAAKTDFRQVVLRPGPGVTQSFDGSRKIQYHWDLQLIGGIAKHLTTLDQGDKVWSKYPVLTIRVGGELDLDKLDLPKGLTVITLADLKARTMEGLKSKDQTVRGWSAGVLAELDPYDPATRDAIGARLKDQVNWVRLNAVHSLPGFGRKAQALLPMLRETMNTDDKQLREAAEKSIETIEKAEDRTAAERVHQEQLARIGRFLAARKE